MRSKLRFLKHNIKGTLNRFIMPVNYKPVITSPIFKPEEKLHDYTLLIVCRNGFNQNVLNANSSMRIAFANGFAQTGGTAILVSVFELRNAIREYENPIIFLSQYDYLDIRGSTLRLLKDVKKIVWVGPHKQRSKEFRAKFLDLGSFEISNSNFKKIVDSQPDFVWNAVGEDGIYWHDEWIKLGLKFVKMFPACDTSRFFPDRDEEKFGYVKIAYVGGYWQEKANAFDLYLRPWENDLTVFGYRKWPYTGYRGYLKEDDERKLYSTAQVVPLVTSPAGWGLAEITERYLKAPGCKGACVADQNPACKELFSPDELLMASNVSEFHDMVHEILNNHELNIQYRESAYRAVLSKHTYKHRVEQILRELEIQI